MAERVRLGELLVETGLIDQQALERALEIQKTDGRRLGQILVAQGFISEAKVTQVLSQQLSVPWVSLAHIDFSRQLLNLVPPDCAEKYGVVPIYVRRGKNREQTLYVAMMDPSDSEPLLEIQRWSGLAVRPMIAPPTDIRAAIRAYYLGLPPEDEEAVNEETGLAPVSTIPVSSVKPLPLAPMEPAPPPPATVPEIGEIGPPSEGLSEDEKLVVSRDSQMPSPKTSSAAPKMVTLTLLDGTQIRLPARQGKRAPVGGDGSLTARDLVEALRAHAQGADVSEVLGPDVSWEKLFASMLALLMKKKLIHDWEFVRELSR